ncbi:hypothetical protein OZX57_04465 [Bifidobacterium sp. ESL0682]|uniref:hypothetical protein n=1 Tax=Bifidobacterium sp. ESL0682 TaxID=2983212 RepID=UPI0023F9B4C7|nr:hypothetical protein [Bifidobacterium sp. ESL0682]WEV41334.1 hypothetical protein OZX57_04465 [Bifidobacterium sp. ESL0682]
MNVVSAVIRVELVNGSNILTDYILPVLAIAISLGTLIWSIWNNQRDKAKIKISTGSAIFLTDGAPPMISITATQVGQAGQAKVTGIGFLVKSTGRQIIRPSSLFPADTPLPKTLEAGDQAVAFYEIAGIAETCSRYGLDPKNLRPFVRTTRKLIKGKMSKGLTEDICNIMK